MSGRLLRRVLKEQEEQQLHDEELDDEPDDSPKRGAPSRNLFDLLGDQEDVEEADDLDNQGDAAEQAEHVTRNSSNVVAANIRKTKKKKKKGKDDKPRPKSDVEKIEQILEDLSIINKAPIQQTEQNTTAIQKELEEANSKKHNVSSILAVDPKHLKAENELRKIFGAKVVSSFENSHSGSSSRQVHGGRRVAHNPRKTTLVTPSSYWPWWDRSMSMELLETKEGFHYFRYVHSPSYRHAQEAFEAAKEINDLNAIAAVLAHYPYHVESLLTFAELFKYSGEHQSSADAIAKCLFALECAWHPLFSPLQGNCQLKYTYDTNKPIFSALFSHMKNMDRRGCHRSALEVCKLLLALDHDDPKGALFCIDYFSLRAQEYRWLEQFAEEYQSDNSIWLFPNFSYSLAICRYYLEQDAASGNETSPTGKATSGDLMKQALMLHPLVLQKLVAKAPLKDSAWTQILKHSFFGSAKAGSPTLDHLINIYVERNYIMWRFPELQNLLKEAALLVIEMLKQNNSEAWDWQCVRQEAFSSDKNEYSHLLVSDFSDVVPTLPPEELRPLMVAPHMMHHHHHHHQIPDGNGEAVAPERAPAPRDVAGRNAVAVFLESLLPWVDFGHENHEDHEHPDDGDQNFNDDLH
ncbi:TCF25/Rqc1 protein [Dioscorea alata]|uniref:TCF25/Rqc1 protein n=1 Tax=Dioscorea alata TaxID=55571 RepID=A0ACB7WB90_DIOAL|nr:TCF25/Rqc1 protein [Dioscorea alata]